MKDNLQETLALDVLWTESVALPGKITAKRKKENHKNTGLQS